MTTVRSRQPASMRTLHQALAAPSRPTDEPQGFGEWEGGDMSWAWRQLNRPAALPAPAAQPSVETKPASVPVAASEAKPVVDAPRIADSATDWPAIRSSIAATAPPPPARTPIAPIRVAPTAARPAIRPATARAADPALLAPILFEEIPKPAPARVAIDGMTWSGAAVAETRRAPAGRRTKVLGLSALAILVASGVAYSALQSISGPSDSTMVAAAAAPIGPSFVPAPQTNFVPAPAPAPTPDAVTTASIPRSSDRLPEPATAALPPVQAVTTTVVLPQPVATQPVTASSPLPIGADDPVGDAILIADKDRPATGPVGAAPTPVAQPAPTIVASLPAPRQTPAAAPVTAPVRQSAPVATVAPSTVVPSGPRVQATARDYVNLRTGPSNGSSVVTVIAAGSAVEVIRCNYWCQVEVGGQTGWVYQDFLDGPIDRRSRGRAVVPAPAAPATTAAAQ